MERYYMLTNDETMMLENIVSMLNQSPWNQETKYDINEIKKQCETEDVYTVIEKLRLIDVELHQQYKKNNN